MKFKQFEKQSDCESVQSMRYEESHNVNYFPEDKATILFFKKKKKEFIVKKPNQKKNPSIKLSSKEKNNNNNLPKFELKNKLPVNQNLKNIN